MQVQRQLRAQRMMALELGGSQSGPELRQGTGSCATWSASPRWGLILVNGRTWGQAAPWAEGKSRRGLGWESLVANTLGGWENTCLVPEGAEYQRAKCYFSKRTRESIETHISSVRGPIGKASMVAIIGLIWVVKAQGGTVNCRIWAKFKASLGTSSPTSTCLVT